MTITDIGTGSAALFCTTTLPGCCRASLHRGSQWYFPNGSHLLNNYNLPYYRTRIHPTIPPGPGSVLLHRNPEGTTTGIFCCNIPNASGVTRSLYVGIYTSTTGEWRCCTLPISWINLCEIFIGQVARVSLDVPLSKLGGPRIQGNIQFQLTSEVDAATPVFTLTCTSTGGPATIVSWQRDGVVVPGGMTELTDPVTATYTSTLTVTGRKTGSYCCVVRNDRSTAKSPLLQVQGECNLYRFYFGYYT